MSIVNFELLGNVDIKYDGQENVVRTIESNISSMLFRSSGMFDKSYLIKNKNNFECRRFCGDSGTAVDGTIFFVNVESDFISEPRFYIHVTVRETYTFAIYFKDGQVKTDVTYGRGSAIDVENIIILGNKLLDIENYFNEFINDYNNAVKRERASFSNSGNSSDNINLSVSTEVIFEELFHNTGKSLKAVINEMVGRGYKKSEIIKAVVGVLGDLCWED